MRTQCLMGNVFCEMNTESNNSITIERAFSSDFLYT